MTCLELQTRLVNRDGPPIIFLTGHGDIATTSESNEGGATEKSYTRLLRVLSRTGAVASLVSPVGALRMETSTSEPLLHPSLINIKIHLGSDNASYVRGPCKRKVEVSGFCKVEMSKLPFRK